MSSARFRQKLNEQLRSIQLSCAGYDGGLEHEAIRLALALRVLFHNTPRSKSLMRHLNMANPTLLSTSVGLNDWRDYVVIGINLGSSAPVTCRPKLGTQFRPVPLSKWWRGEIVYEFAGRQYHRADLVLAAANQDGGAHVDGNLERFYEDLASGNQGFGVDGANLIYEKGAPYDQSQVQKARNTHLALIRQFTHETMAAASHFHWLS